MKYSLFFVIALSFAFSCVSAQQEGEPLIAIQLNYSGGNFAVENIYFDSGYKTEDVEDYEYILKLLDENNGLLDTLNFKIPEISLSPPPEWFDKQGDQVVKQNIPEVTHRETFYFSRYENLKYIYIFDKTGNELLKIDIADYDLYCGDNVCQSNEDISKCPEDCSEVFEAMRIKLPFFTFYNFIISLLTIMITYFILKTKFKFFS